MSDSITASFAVSAVFELQVLELQALALELQASDSDSSTASFAVSAALAFAMFERMASKNAKKTAELMPLERARGPTPRKNAVGPPFAATLRAAASILGRCARIHGKAAWGSGRARGV